MKREADAIMLAESGADTGAGQAYEAISPVLRAHEVDKIYGNGTHALDSANLDIQRGEFVSLLGPSGCGKSTLLKMFAGLETATSGSIGWYGEDGIEKAEPDRSMSMVFQEATLMPWARVAANVRLPLDLAGTPRSEADERVKRALEMVGLEKFDKSYPRELSGGMQMRVSIARSLVTNPRVLLMDEPFGALDEFTRNKLDSDLYELWLKSKFTVVFVTHSIYEAVFLSSRVVVMTARPGRIIADIKLDAPEVRDEAYRVSKTFVEYCGLLSDHLVKANQA